MTDLVMGERALAGWRGLLGPLARSQLALVTAGVGLHAFNEFAIAAALPLGLSQLGGLDHIAWIYGVYYTGSMAGGICGGVVKRRLGARGAMLAAGALFLLGLVLAANASGWAGLLAGRGVQGLADGLVLAVCYAIIPEVFAAALVPRVFAVEAVVWALAALIGPLAGGLAVRHLGWRAAMAAALPLALAFLALAAWVAPRARDLQAGGPAGRVLALSLAAAGALALPALLPGPGYAPLPVLLSALLFRAALRCDRRARQPLFPAGMFDPRRAFGCLLWVVFLMPCGAAATYAFQALALGRVFALGPTAVGYLMVLGPLIWSAVALGAGMIDGAAGQRLLRLAGPAVLILGFLGAGIGFATGAAPLMLIGLGLRGAGFGLCWGPLNHAAMEAAAEGQRDRASAVLPGIAVAGDAVGAALGGALAGATGLVTALAPGGGGGPVLWQWGGGAALAALALLAATGAGRRRRG